MKALVEEADGYYSYWETGRRAPLKELLVNEGLSVQVSRLVSPGHAAWEYFGYGRRQYGRVRELEPVITRAVRSDFERSALGLRLRYLSGGVGDEARAIERHVIPERSGYYIGSQLVAAALETNGPAWSVRATADELLAAGNAAAVASA
jgi:hypothetical protein